VSNAEAAAVSLERAARLVREMPLSDRTLAVAEMLGMLTQRILETSPADQADLAAAVLARWMHS
jgi:hypothetical protein